MAMNQIRRVFRPGEQIFGEGEAGDCAYIIENGAVEISTGQGVNKTVLAHRHAGDIFGEMAIVDSKPRSATVTAIEACQLLLVSKEQMQARIQTLDPVLRMVLNVILDRFRNSVRQVNGETPLDPDPVDAPAPDPLADYASAVDRIELEQTVKQAFEDGQMTLFYQPLVKASTERIFGFEALARWNHPEHGVLSPGHFIDAVQDSGLMSEFTRWVVRKAARDAAQFAALKDSIIVSVNVGADDICDPSFAEDFQAALDAAKLPAERMDIEVTEASLASKPELAMEMLHKLKALGVSISIDDFGTGYSNLIYLTRYPLHKLKIDRVFITKLLSSDENEQVVSAIVQLSHAIGLLVVAEGVETDEQATVLRKVGCDLFQGFGYFRPMPFEEACKVLVIEADAERRSA